MPFVLYLAWRFLGEGRAQATLIVVGVAVGVGVQVFVTALIAGLQKDLVESTVGVQAHVVVEPREEEVREMLRSRVPGGTVVAANLDRPAQRIRSIEAWPRLVRSFEGVDGVRAVSPLAQGPGLAIHGSASTSVVVSGIVPDTYDAIVPIASHMARGQYRIGGRDVLVGSKLADDLGVSVGDLVRLETAGGRAQLFTVRGIFDLGSKEANAHWALVSLRAGQTLFGLPGGATHLYVAVDDVFDAERVAGVLRERSGLDIESWMTANAQLLAALKSQSGSSDMIRFFVLVAVAMGITSVLVVSVVQRSGQIGILRAIGASRSDVMWIFLLQGGFMGFVGSVIGCFVGAALALGFQAATLRFGGVYHTIELDLPLFASATGIAMVTGLLAAALPARSAAGLDPAVAIHHA